MVSRTGARLALGCLGLLALAGVAVVGGVTYVDRADRAATAQLVAALDASAAADLPPGTDRAPAEAWFAAHGMTASAFGPNIRDSQAEGHGIPTARLGGVLRGTTRQPLHYGYNEVSVYVYLDPDGKVIKHRVAVFHIGL
jgi:hypothetical protein